MFLFLIDTRSHLCFPCTHVFTYSVAARTPPGNFELLSFVQPTPPHFWFCQSSASTRGVSRLVRLIFHLPMAALHLEQCIDVNGSTPSTALALGIRPYTEISDKRTTFDSLLCGSLSLQNRKEFRWSRVGQGEVKNSGWSGVEGNGAKWDVMAWNEIEGVDQKQYAG